MQNLKIEHVSNRSRHNSSHISCIYLAISIDIVTCHLSLAPQLKSNIIICNSIHWSTKNTSRYKIELWSNIYTNAGCNRVYISWEFGIFDSTFWILQTRVESIHPLRTKFIIQLSLKVYKKESIIYWQFYRTEEKTKVWSGIRILSENSVYLQSELRSVGPCCK